MAKTIYLNNKGEIIPATLKLESATPNDTTVFITPRVSGATTHKITWPAVGSKTKPKVLYYDNAGLLKQDQDFSDYWLRVAKEALHNANFNWIERNLGEARKLKPIEEKLSGGALNDQLLKDLAFNSNLQAVNGIASKNLNYEQPYLQNKIANEQFLNLLNKLKINFVNAQPDLTLETSVIPGIRMAQRMQSMAARHLAPINSLEMRGADLLLHMHFGPQTQDRNIVGLQKCGGKMKKKLMRQGGKIIEVPFENK